MDKRPDWAVWIDAAAVVVAPLLAIGYALAVARLLYRLLWSGAGIAVQPDGEPARGPRTMECLSEYIS
jgi:hypothetical protein